MNNSISLLELLREQKQKKGRPLKVICDWDEVIQPSKPLLLYWTCKDLNLPFKDFFEKFWENIDLNYYNHGGAWSKGFYVSDDINSSAKASDGRIDNKVLKALFKREKNFYSNSPFLSFAEDLLKAFSEDLIENLVLITSFTKGDPSEHRNPNNPNYKSRKEKKYDKTFGKNPLCKFEATALEVKVLDSRKTDPRPYRWEVLKSKYPDFDIFIDDNNNIITKTRDFFADAPEKIYVLTDYKCNRRIQAPNIYHVKTTVSDLKDEDFEKVAQEIKAKKAQQSQSKPEPKNYWPWIIACVLIGIVVIIGLTVYFWKKKKTKKRR